MEDQEPRAPWTWVAEAVPCPGGSSGDGARTDSLSTQIAEELYLAVEDEHRVNVVVDVRRYLEGRLELELVDRELGEVNLDRDDTVCAFESFALAWPADKRCDD